MSSFVRRRFVFFLAVLACGTAAASAALPLHEAAVAGFDLAAFAYLAAAVPLWTGGTPDVLRRHAAERGDAHVLLPVVAACVVWVIVCALGLVMVSRAKIGPTDLALVVATLTLAWCFANTVFAFHYAHLYYDIAERPGTPGGLIFPGEGEPSFSDFCYFSFVVGMTFQVSDVAIAAPALRKSALIHGVIAFFYNIGVLALTINVLAGLS